MDVLRYRRNKNLEPNIYSVMSKYGDKYVLCFTCKGGNTLMKRESKKRQYFSICECGSKR